MADVLFMTYANIFSRKLVAFWLKCLLKFVPNGLIDNESVLVHTVNWRRTGDKVLPEPVISHFTYTSVAVPQCDVALLCHRAFMNLVTLGLGNGLYDGSKSLLELVMISCQLDWPLFKTHFSFSAFRPFHSEKGIWKYRDLRRYLFHYDVIVMPAAERIVFISKTLATEYTKKNLSNLLDFAQSHVSMTMMMMCFLLTTLVLVRILNLL